MRLLVVCDDSELGGNGPRSRQQGGEHRPVRLVDLARPEALARRAQLRSRDEHADARPLRATHLADAGSGERAHLRRAEPDARLEHGASRADVAAARADVRPGLDRGVELDRTVDLTGQLELNDRVGAVGYDPARCDPHRLPGLEHAGGRASGGNPARERKPNRGAPRVLGPERVAVHRRAREGRQIARGQGRLCEHPPERPLDRHALGLERSYPFEHQLQRVVDRDRLGHGPERIYSGTASRRR